MQVADDVNTEDLRVVLLEFYLVGRAVDCVPMLTRDTWLVARAQGMLLCKVEPPRVAHATRLRLRRRALEALQAFLGRCGEMELLGAAKVCVCGCACVRACVGDKRRRPRAIRHSQGRTCY